MLEVILITVFVLGLAGAGALIWWRQHKKTHHDGKVGQLSGALLSKEIQTEILIESITDGIIVTDTENKITLFNKGASTITQWPAEEAMGINAVSVLTVLADDTSNTLIAPESHPLCVVLKNKQSLTETYQIISRGNKRIYISLAISPVILPKTNEVVGTVAVFRDVSKEKSEEQARADFVSTASHEMRTPVAAIEGYLALAMNDKVSQIDAKAREYLEKAHSSTQHLGQLFQDLLTSAKAEDGRLSSHPIVIEAAEYLDRLSEDMRFGAEKKGLQMEFITSTLDHSTGGIVDARGKTIHPLFYVHADPDRLREVLTNLIDNAIKYTDEGKITIAVTGNNEVVQISIKDSGPGIPVDDIPHLFQKFYRVDNSATRTIGGTGLGLFICKKIIELYHGTIWAESKVGEGSTFYINLPRLNTQRAHELQEMEKAGRLA